MDYPKRQLMPFLSFNGNAEEAMNYYVKVFGAKIEMLNYFKEGQGGDVGTVMNGIVDFDGCKLLFLDMSKQYPAPDFSWATSLMLTYEDEAAFGAAYTAIAADGNVMMEPAAVGNIRKCCWVVDKYNVTWQLVWE